MRALYLALALTACTSATAPPDEPPDFSQCLIGHATDTLPYRLVDPVRMDTLRYHCPDLLR